MTAEETVVTLDRQASLLTLGGVVLEIELDWVRREDYETVVARFELPVEMWRIAHSTGAFHLDGVVEPPAFDTGRPVELYVRLRSAVATSLPVDDTEFATIIGAFEEPLTRTEAWYATEVLQEVPLPENLADDAWTSSGIRTRWADADDGLQAEPNGGPSPAIWDIITDYLEEKSWPYEVVDDDLVRLDAIIDEHKRWRVLIHVEPGQPICTIYSVYPERVPERTRHEAASLLISRNYELESGAFGMNGEDGTVRARNQLAPTAEVFGDALTHNITAMADAFGELSELTAKADGDRSVSDTRPTESD
jgi:hypothetical protein